MRNQRRSTLLDQALDFIEAAGNRLPHPVTLFFLLALSVLAGSWIFSAAGVTAIHPTTGKVVTAVNLVSAEGLRRIVTSLVNNFTGFVPLGTVLVAMLGVGVAEGSGLLTTALRAVVLAAPKRILTAVVVFTGILSNTASEAGYVILVPLAAILFLTVGRHPLAGLAAAFAGVSGGYSANLVLGTVDPLLAGLTTEAARLLDPGYTVNPAANWYFMAASTVFLTVLGTAVTEWIVEPRLGRYEGAAPAPVQALTPPEKRGLAAAAAALVGFNALLVWATAPAGAVLRNPQTGGLLDSPFLGGIVAIIFAAFLAPGLAYGIAAGTIRRDADAIDAMSKTMSTLGGYLVLVFFAAQFVAFFNWTNIGVISAIQGAQFLKSIGLTGPPLIAAFILTAGVLNLFMGSASAKWAIMAPVFVPMFMLLGYTPELTQAAYRIGDSCTNIVTPMMSYFALIIAFAQKYSPAAGIGTIIATMLPYTAFFLITWTLFLLAWMLLGWPVGPGAALYLAR